MKTAIRKSLVLVAIILTATVSYGNEISGNTNNGKSARTNVTFKDVKKGTVLSIKDKNGLILFKESIQQNGDYSKGFDLTSLPDGDYYFELNKEVEIKVVPFKVTASLVEFDKTAEVSFFKPVVFVNRTNVHVSKMAIGNDIIEVEILSSNGDTVHKEKIEKEGYILGQIYDFSTSQKGVYTIVMKTNGRRFVENIQI